jgi:hypothetical protein
MGCSGLLWVGALVLGAGALVGCQEVTSSNTAPLTRTVSGFDPEVGGQGALEGVKLCQTDTTKCALSDVNGVATIEVPFDQETSFTLEKDGYGSVLVPIFLSKDGGAGPSGMGTDQAFEKQFDRVMSKYPMEGTGTIRLSLTGAFAGVTFELVGGTGKAYYEDEDGNWSLGLTATTSRGRGGFVEVSPGEVEVVYGGTAQGCLVDVGWPGNVENGIRFPVREGFQTFLTMGCPLAP